MHYSDFSSILRQHEAGYFYGNINVNIYILENNSVLYYAFQNIGSLKKYIKPWVPIIKMIIQLD